MLNKKKGSEDPISLKIGLSKKLFAHLVFNFVANSGFVSFSRMSKAFFALGLFRFGGYLSVFFSHCKTPKLQCQLKPTLNIAY